MTETDILLFVSFFQGICPQFCCGICWCWVLFILPPVESPCRLFPAALVEQLGDDSWCVQLAAIQRWLYAWPVRIYQKRVCYLFCSFKKKRLFFHLVLISQIKWSTTPACRSFLRFFSKSYVDGTNFRNVCLMFVYACFVLYCVRIVFVDLTWERVCIERGVLKWAFALMVLRWPCVADVKFYTWQLHTFKLLNCFSFRERKKKGRGKKSFKKGKW